MRNRNSIVLFVCAAFAGILLTLAVASCGRMSIKTEGPAATAASPKFSVNVFVENSGSMNGYMCQGAEFKDALYSYLTALNSHCETMKLNYVNSQVVPLPAPVSDLVERLNPTAFAQAGGNTTSSNFKQIFRDVLSQVNEHSVAILVSDCILDIPKGAASNYLNIIQTDINNIVTDKLKKMPSLGVCVYQMESLFDGNYYFPKGGLQAYKGKRPYYVWLVGARENLAYILRNIPSSRIQHGVKNFCGFAPTVAIPNAFYAGGKPQGKMPLNVQRGGECVVQVEADLTSTLQGEEYWGSTASYGSATEAMKVTKVERLPDAVGYSHLLTVSVAGKPFSDFLTIKPTGLPQWVTASNGKKDDAIENGKTFSIQYIIGGVADAYEKYKEAGKMTITTSKH